MIALLLSAPAHAQRSPAEYDTMLDDLTKGLTIYDGPVPSQPQMAPGVTGVIGPADPTPIDHGEVHTSRGPGPEPVYTERWILHDPEKVLAGVALEFPYLGGSDLQPALDHYNGLDDAKEYGLITFSFQYMELPYDMAVIQALPNAVPSWVTPYRYEVRTVTDNGYSVSGALYRERRQTADGVFWREAWVLWSNYIPPCAEHPDVRTEIVPLPGPAGTIKSYLLGQLSSNPGSTFVLTAREAVQPLPEHAP